jgi:N-acetylmuramoyl-L-alanine amidase
MLQNYIRFSPNHNDRPAEPISLIVLHYTGMTDGKEALEWLCNGSSGVSAHYMIEEDGEVVQLVEEDRRAWHAGVSHWEGRDNINDISIGIELVNPGHEHGYRPFPEAQMRALLALTHNIMQRHEIPASGVVGHSDIAPERKQDPGELFPWEWMAMQGAAIWHHCAMEERTPEPAEFDQAAITKLRQLGYQVSDSDPIQQEAVITAFQRRFCPDHLTGQWHHLADTALNALLEHKAQA